MLCLGHIGWEVEVDALVFDGVGTFLDLGVDGADVFAHDAEEDELERSGEEDSDEHGSEAEAEGLPEEHLEDEVDAGDDKGKRSTRESGKGSEAQRNSGVINDAKHSNVVEGVEVVLGKAALAGGLVVGDFFVGKTDFGDHAAEVWVRIAEGADEVYDFAIVEAEAGEVLKGFDAGEALGELVVLAPCEEEEGVFFAGALDAEHHGIAVFPLFEEGGDEGGRVLKVSDYGYDGIAAGLKDGMNGRADVTEVASVDDDFDVGVVGRETLEDGDGGVGGGVVDKDVLVPVAANRRHNRPDLMVELLDVAFLVVTSGDDADSLHA